MTPSGPRMPKRIAGQLIFIVMFLTVANLPLFTFPLNFFLNDFLRTNCPEIECLWGRDFPHPSRQFLGPTQPPIQWVAGLSLRKPPGNWIDHAPPSSTEVKERVELYNYSSYWPSWSVLWRLLPLTYLTLP
jgi:hypothetical protein